MNKTDELAEMIKATNEHLDSTRSLIRDYESRLVVFHKIKAGEYGIGDAIKHTNDALLDLKNEESYLTGKHEVEVQLLKSIEGEPIR